MLSKLKTLTLIIASLFAAVTFANETTIKSTVKVECKVLLPNVKKALKCTNKKYTRTIKALYNRHLRRKPSDLGDINVLFTTNENGNTKTIKVESALKLRILIVKIKSFSKSATFPNISKKHNSFTYVFTASK